MTDEDNPKMPAGSRSGKAGRAALGVVGGAIPFAGGLFSAAAGFWSEHEQGQVNEFLQHWVKMLKEEL